MAYTGLNTSSATYNQLISNGGVFKVPAYQRDYSWEEEYWEDLWLDILGLAEEKVHYMGYIVLQADSKDSKKFYIIDGQQRFATLSILVLAVIKVINDWIGEGIDVEDNKQRIEILQNQYLSFKPATSLILTSKLELNHNNNNFYKSFILRLRKPTNIGKLKPSEKKLLYAFNYFYEKVKDKFLKTKSGEEISKFLNEYVGDNLIFTTITVNDDLNAYKVFETLNARGVKLSATDLLKNLLFSIVAKTSEAEIEEAERQWYNINNTLGFQEFPTFLRHYWNSRNTLERKQTLYKALKKTINTRDDVFKILEDLEKLSPVYVALSNSIDSIWSKPDDSKNVDALSIFGVSQCYPLLLSAYEVLSDSEFTKLLRDCVIISFRYNVIGGLNPNIMEDVYNKAAIKIAKNEVSTSREIFNDLKSIYVTDENFKSAFSTKIINSKRYRKLVRYILFCLEKQISGNSYDDSDTKITIEHILPENASDIWNKYFNVDEQDIYTYRLGNYTLLEDGKNKDCGDKLYEEKLPIYETSRYSITKEYCIFEEWTPASLRKRQDRLANFASSIWKIIY